jgi:hypothetical protein
MTSTGADQGLPRPCSADALLVPITLELSPIRRLLVIDVADDPTYRTLEPQVLDGPDGPGLVLLAYRHDDHVEVYADSGSHVDPSGYDGLGKGLLGIRRTAFRPGRFEVTGDGLKVDIAFTAPDGRRVDLHLHEHLTGPRDRIPVLAPVGGGFDTPEFFPFIWFPGLSFVPVRGTEVTLRVDGQQRSIPRLPLPIGGRRCLMARYDPDAMVCQLNPSRVSGLPEAPTRRDGLAGMRSPAGTTRAPCIWTHRCPTSRTCRLARGDKGRSCCRPTASRNCGGATRSPVLATGSTWGLTGSGRGARGSAVRCSRSCSACRSSAAGRPPTAGRPRSTSPTPCPQTRAGPLAGHGPLEHEA